MSSTGKKEGGRIMGNGTADGSRKPDRGGDSEIETDQKQLKRIKPYKRVSKKTQETGLISNLPDEVLIEILSFLPTKDAVKSSILSKCWRQLWKSVHNIDFRQDDSINDDEFIEIVNKYIEDNNCPEINKFSIQWDLMIHGTKDPSVIHRWVRFALKRDVKDLRLLFHYEFGDFYPLPRCLYATSSPLRRLKLSYCSLGKKVFINWKGLKNIVLQNVKMCDRGLSNLLTSCPSLEVMELCDFFWIRNLKINSSRLKRLKLENFDIGFDDETEDYFLLKISAPHLKSLEISGDLERMICKLKNVSSLDEADLSFHLSYTDVFIDYEARCKKMLIGLVQSLKNVKELKIGAWCIWILSALEFQSSRPQALNCRSLTLRSEIAKWDLLGIGRLIRASPYLETLVIEMDTPADFETRFFRSTNLLRSYDFDVKNYFESIEKFARKKSMDLLPSLRNVQIKNFGKRFYEQDDNHKLTFELDLVQFLLKNAIKLENIDIKLPTKGCNNCSTGLFEIVATKLLGFPKSSFNARVNVL